VYLQKLYHKYFNFNFVKQLLFISKSISFLLVRCIYKNYITNVSISTSLNSSCSSVKALVSYSSSAVSVLVSVRSAILRVLFTFIPFQTQISWATPSAPAALDPVSSSWGALVGL